MAKEFIEKKAAKKYLRELSKPGEYNGVVDLIIPYCYIEKVPAADVRPVVRGKWNPDYDYAEYDFDGSTPLPEPRKFQDGWQCSLCGKYMPWKANYCPNCGADMKGEADGT